MTVSLPKILWGVPVQRGDRAPVGDGAVEVGVLDESDVEALVAQDRDLLADVPLHAITAFLYRVGKLWRSPEFPRRRLYVRHLQALGWSSREAEAEADLVALVLSSRSLQTDIVRSELGDPLVLDDWVLREETWVRAMPVGLVVHLLPGNVPLSSVVSLLRALVTKNVSFGKLASGDPATLVCLAQSFTDVDPDHPVTRAVSAGYWAPSTDVAKQVVAAADGICAWGDDDAIRWAVAHARPGAPVVSFGPKRSICLVSADADPRRVADDIAHDVCHYDQQAWFSTQQVFVEEAVLGQLVDALVDAMTRYATILPIPRRTPDAAAAATLYREEERFLGSLVAGAPDGSWSLLVTCDPPPLHPLCRTVVVRPVARVEDALAEIGPDVQTVAVAPWARSLDIRDALAARGVARIVEVGASNFLRPGGPHDGRFPLQQLVRWVGHEAPKAHLGTSLVAPLDQTQILAGGRYTDLLL